MLALDPSPHFPFSRERGPALQVGKLSLPPSELSAKQDTN